MSLKNRSKFSSTLDIDLKGKLNDLSNETKVPISKLLDEAIELLIQNRTSHRDKNERIK